MVSRSGRPAGVRSSARRYGAGFWQREDGYNLIVLAVMVTVFNIMVAKALPLWSSVIQREKEAELIFRGMQYAEAIRIYEIRTGSLPTKLEQLIELEQRRCIRQLWKNPMTEDGAWELIPLGAGGQRVGQAPGPDGRGDPGRGDPGRGGALPGDPSRPDPSLRWVPGGENKTGSVPIIGVKSPGGGQAIKTFVANPNAPAGGGSNEISEWLFTHELAKALVIPQGQQTNQANPIVPSMNVEQRFRPWPPDVKPIFVPMGGSGSRPGDKSAVTPGGTRPTRGDG